MFAWEKIRYVGVLNVGVFFKRKGRKKQEMERKKDRLEKKVLMCSFTGGLRVSRCVRVYFNLG